MLKYTFFLFLILVALQGFAQPHEVRVELNETFAQYQNAYNNASEAYKLLEKGYKRSMNLSDARYYLGSARKFTNTANLYSSKAEKASEATLLLPSVKSCNVSEANYGEMKSCFQVAAEKFNAAFLELDEAMELTDFDIIGVHLSSATAKLQSGVLKLNQAVEEMNEGSSEMKACK